MNALFSASSFSLESFAIRQRKYHAQTHNMALVGYTETGTIASSTKSGKRFDMTRHSSAASLVGVLLVLAFVPRIACAQTVTPRRDIPRTSDGKPDFTGVYAGPGFTHQVGPGDTDEPRITLY